MAASNGKNSTGFFWDEKCFWHSGGNYAFLLPVGGLVQPLAAGGIPENPETKRRLKNLLEVSGLIQELAAGSAPPATRDQLGRVHPATYLDEFKELSDGRGGELGQRTPFGPGGYEIAALSAGLAISAVERVLRGELHNAYALSRPPGHHCLPDYPMGFCLLANIAIAIENARATGLAERFAVIDWDVHHGNGTETIFYERDDVLTISLHQENNYPRPSGDLASRGAGRGEGHNINVPLLPGGGHTVYLHAFDRIVAPAVRKFRPDIIIVACGFDASGVDPLSRMIASAATFGEMTRRTVELADGLCGGKLVAVHEGGYSETHVPFCGHAVLEVLSGTSIRVEDALNERLMGQQPNARFDKFHMDLIDEWASGFGLK